MPRTDSCTTTSASKDELLAEIVGRFSFLPALRRLLAVAPGRPAGAVLPLIATGFSALLSAYVLVVLLGANGLYAERWMRQVERAADAGGEQLSAWQRSSRPLWSTGAAGLLTLAVVFVMVVKPTLWLAASEARWR